MEINGLVSVPMYFVSPVADSSLAYANIVSSTQNLSFKSQTIRLDQMKKKNFFFFILQMAEWLSTSKQNRVYLPEEPFPHGQLVKCGRLKSFKNLHDEAFSAEYRQPCVMFAGHPSLRFGEVIHFIELWGNNPNNTIVFTGKLSHLHFPMYFFGCLS